MDLSRLAHSPYSRHHTFWSLDGLDRHGDSSCGTSSRHAPRYPVRALRYWFMDHLLQREYALQQRPLTICEMGVGSGALLRFVNRAAAIRPRWIASWDAVSRRIDRSALALIGYNRCIEADIEELALDVGQPYDVIVVLHVLEHLYEPEAALTRLLPWLKPGGIIIGGAPTLPDLFRSARERQIRKDAEPFGHVSVISPYRLKRAAQRLQLSVEFLTGAYMLRSTGSRLEQSRFWLRLNLLFGSLCPNWPGEVYWSIRKPTASELALQIGAKCGLQNESSVVVAP